MKNLTRNEVIEKLIDNDIDTILNCGEKEYLYNILKSGMKGYDNYTKEELYQEYKERFNEGVIIK